MKSPKLAAPRFNSAEELFASLDAVKALLVICS
jgi:hypothetical protein